MTAGSSLCKYWHSPSYKYDRHLPIHKVSGYLGINRRSASSGAPRYPINGLHIPKTVMIVPVNQTPSSKVLAKSGHAELSAFENLPKNNSPSDFVKDLFSQSLTASVSFSSRQQVQYQ